MNDQKRVSPPKIDKDILYIKARLGLLGEDDPLCYRHHPRCPIELANETDIWSKSRVAFLGAEIAELMNKVEANLNAVEAAEYKDDFTLINNAFKKLAQTTFPDTVELPPSNDAHATNVTLLNPKPYPPPVETRPSTAATVALTSPTEATQASLTQTKINDKTPPNQLRNRKAAATPTAEQTVVSQMNELTQGLLSKATAYGHIIRGDDKVVEEAVRMQDGNAAEIHSNVAAATALARSKAWGNWQMLFMTCIAAGLVVITMNFMWVVR